MTVRIPPHWPGPTLALPASLLAGDPREAAVTKVPVAPSIREHTLLAKIDYSDAFLVRVGAPRRLTAEQWARRVLEEAPLATRLWLSAGWRAIGLKLDEGSPRSSVCGWELRYNTPNAALLGAESHIGMPAELLFKREPGALLFATFVEQRNQLARLTWRATEPTHPLIVQRLLAHAVRATNSGVEAQPGEESGPKGDPGAVGFTRRPR